MKENNLTEFGTSEQRLMLNGLRNPMTDTRKAFEAKYPSVPKELVWTGVRYSPKYATGDFHAAYTISCMFEAYQAATATMQAKVDELELANKKLRDETIEECEKVVLYGNFLTDTSMEHKFALSCAKAIRNLKSTKET